MTHEYLASDNSAGHLSGLPGWAAPQRVKALEEAAFLSGAALASLHPLVTGADVPQTLWRARLSLQAAEACLMLTGRSERATDLRDAINLLRPGDEPGPAGEIYLQWRRAVERPVSIKALHRAFPGQAPEQIAEWLDAGHGTPVHCASAVIQAVLCEVPRAEVVALILADAALARALGWAHVVPLFSVGLRRRDLLGVGDDLRLACHRALVRSTQYAIGLMVELERKAARLKAVAPKLRTKGAEGAIEMFLTCDVVAPTALPLPDRAARRLCDRLVSLGAVRELTGRDTFRLYGV